MSEIKSFKDLLVWQKGHQLVLEIYRITADFPDTEIYGLVSQMRRAAVSVVSNLVEGFKRRTVKDSVHFYNIADGSIEELKYQLFLSRDLNYITQEEFQKTNSLLEEVSKMLRSWSASQKANYRGLSS